MLVAHNYIARRLYSANFVIVSMTNLIVNKNQLHTCCKLLVAYNKISTNVIFNYLPTSTLFVINCNFSSSTQNQQKTNETTISYIKFPNSHLGDDCHTVNHDF
jgi:hypothetical protein